jgi:hypothetical protein
MACVDVALGAVGSADLVVTGDGTTETALGEVLTDANVRTAALADTPLGGVGSATEVQVAETAGDCLAPPGCTEATGDVPADCDAGWPSCYKVADASLAEMQACGGEAGSADPEWDGLLTNKSACSSAMQDWSESGSSESLATKAFHSAYVLYIGGAFYELQITVGNSTVCWDGYKYVGDSPVGTYDFADYSDCSPASTGPATICIEECPA